jgi:uncharacterized protein YdeI (YjbR/CyaY-like superfamily)
MNPMGRKDPRVDAYIEKSADFAKPILRHIRKVVHAALPEVEEDLKWRMPAFMYKGIVCGMAAFKSHCTFGFWKGSLLTDGKQSADAMGQFGRIESLSDLPSDTTLAALVKRAAKLNDDGVKVARMAPKGPRKPLRVPSYLTAALKKNKQAHAAFQELPYSHKKEYVEWLTEAKTDTTRQKRLETAIGWIAEGKARNWKYM